MKYLISAFVIVISISVGFYGGREYEAYYYNTDDLFTFNQELKDSLKKVHSDANRMSDLIRHYIDDLRDTTEVKIEDHGAFEELAGLYLWDDALGSIVNLTEYYNAY